MPFDMTQTCTRLGVRDAAVRLGIEPLSNELLADYMEAQLRKHPGSFLYRHQAAAVALMCLTTLILVTTGGALLPIGVALGSVLLVGVGAASVILALCMNFFAPSMPIKKPARWHLAYVMNHDIPTEIAAMTNEILALAPRSRAVIGLLIQEKTVLDPFVVIRDIGGAEIVIGIWDDTGILHIAKRH